MSSAPDYEHAGSSSSSPEARDEGSSRRQSRTPATPRKRRRIASVDPARVRKYYLEGKYNDAYRVLYNDDVNAAAARFHVDDGASRPVKHIGASLWSARERTVFFAALQRLGRHNAPAIAAAVASKSIPEVHEYLLLLQDSAASKRGAGLTLRDIPAAIDISPACTEKLELAGEALAWQQDMFDASQEQDKFGDHWLISPAIAAEIEDAVHGRTARALSATPSEEHATLRRGGRVVIGACVSCKKFKQRCDRGAPCSNCARRKAGECVYANDSMKHEAQQGQQQGREREQAQQQKQEQQQQQQHEAAHAPSSILASIPEAGLLQPHVMLMLSKTLFMNRSPTIPSPWPHWSEYVSELAEEPSMYRTAFNDFHTLVVSVTRRLVSTAIMQATSRLRARQRRVSKGHSPYVKRQDVLTALDILGMARNGKERWRGVARRCGVRVYEGSHRVEDKTRRKGTRELTWNEVENLLTVQEQQQEHLTTDTELSTGDESEFKVRAARSGTPLPIDQLILSSPERGSDDNDDNDDDDDDDAASSSSSSSPTDLGSVTYTDESTFSSPQYLDGPFRKSRGFSVDPMSGSKALTLEQFDHHESRLAEQALWSMLKLEPPVTDEPADPTDTEEVEDRSLNDKIMTEAVDWRSWIDYRASWEEFSSPIPEIAFVSNQTQETLLNAPLSMSKTSLQEAMRPGHKSGGERELRARSTVEYAALQGAAWNLDHANSVVQGSQSGGDRGSTVPAQSSETADDYDYEHDEGVMDWE